MSDKRVKAWAVVDKRGNVVSDAIGMFCTYKTKHFAKRDCVFDEGERVVRATIIVEDE